MITSEQSFQRIALTSLVVTAIVFGALAAYTQWQISLNFVVGATVGLLSLATLRYLVYCLVPDAAQGAGRTLWAMAMLHVGKYGLIAVGLYVLFSTGWGHPLALTAGFTVPTVVLCLKEAGRRLNAKLGVQTAQPTDAEDAGRESRCVEG